MVFKSRKLLSRKSFARIILFSIVFLVVSSFQFPSQHYTLTRVCIDAGHGGHDTGCIGGKVKEKDVALGIALKLGKYIEDHFPEVKVIYTRKTDVFVELHERAAIANNAKADLFIWVHCNSACYRDKKKKKDVCNDETNGVETWVMGLHKSEANLEVSKRENEVVLLEKDYNKKYDGFDPNSPEANIIFSLYQNAYLDQILKMASLIQNEVVKKGREERGVKQAGFLVLFKTYMPSVLIETGFLTNTSEAKFLSSEKGQDSMARSFFEAFKSYKSSVESGETGNGGDKVPTKAESDNEVEAKAGHANDSAAKDKNSIGVSSPETGKGNSQKKSSGISEPRYNGKQKTAAARSDKESIYEFAVQVVSSYEKLKSGDKKFRGQSGFIEENDNNLFKYTTQHCLTFDVALELQKKMQEAGFTDSFVVAYKSNKRIPLKQARDEMKGAQ
ncbi:N-acetylmuramoyl-L-alanine amidase [soil metagenome]